MNKNGLWQRLKIPLSHTEKNLGQMVFALVTELWLLLLLRGWFRTNSHLFAIKTRPRRAPQAPETGCRSVCAKSKQWDLSVVWHFVTSVMGSAADVQLVFTGYLGAKAAIQLSD